MNLDLLKRLCETPGVGGREDRVRALIESEIDGFFDEIKTDPMGSLLCTRKATNSGGNKPLKVMLLCHMDEIGFLVTHICEKGFIYFDPVGYFDTRNLFSRRVLVCTENGDFKGVMNPYGKPIHIQSASESEKIPEISEFFVDLGLGEETAQKVKVGDYIVMDEPFIEVGEKLVSKALDNRIACYLGIEVIRTIVEQNLAHNYEIHIAFTTQEEQSDGGLRGAKTAAFRVRPDIAIGIDVTLACDTPGVPEHLAITRHGKGVGLCVKDSSFIADLPLVKEFELVGSENNILTQRFVLPRGGMDAAAAQLAAGGARAIGLQVGTRYIHTVTEMLQKSDLQAAHNLIVAYLTRL